MIRQHKDELDFEIPEGPSYDVELDGHLTDFMNSAADILSKNVTILLTARKKLLTGGKENALSVVIIDAQVEILAGIKNEINKEGERRRHYATLSKF